MRDVPAQFEEHFRRAGVPARIAREVYLLLRDGSFLGRAEVRPGDELYKVYGLCEEDLDDAVLELARRCGCRRPTTQDVSGLPPVRTVEDLVRLIFYLKNLNPPDA